MDLSSKSNSMWRVTGEENDGDIDMEIEDYEEDSEEEIARQRDLIYSTIIPTSSPHGVPSLFKTFDAAVLYLKIARAIDKRLQNNTKIDEFFDYLTTIELDITRTARQGFGHIKVLIIEGLMSSGKSTLINGLKTITRATAITAIPARIVEIKYLFNSFDVPESVSTALDFITNYCIAHQIILDAASKPNGKTYSLLFSLLSHFTYSLLFSLPSYFLYYLIFFIILFSSFLLVFFILSYFHYHFPCFLFFHFPPLRSYAPFLH